MDEFQRRVTSSALAVLGRYGFALAGGYAIAAYGIIDRPSDDVDLFTDEDDPAKFEKAMSEAVTAWEAEGFTTQLTVHSGTFARFYVSDGRQEIKVELCHDWRSEPPTILDVGPVLGRDNSVGNKVAALFSRSEARDYIDVYGARSSGYSRTDLETLGAAHDGGFALALFANVITGHARYPDSEFERYNMTAASIAAMRAEYDEWADEIRSRA